MTPEASKRVSESRSAVPFLRRTLRAAGTFAIFGASLVVSGCRKQDFPQFPPNYREFAYVTNGYSNTVSVLDVVNVRLDREIPVGIAPTALAASPTRNEVYVVNEGLPNGTGSLTILNTENNSVAGTVPLHRQPLSIDLDKDGRLAYVVNFGSNVVSVIDLAARREVAEIATGEQPMQARLTPDGRTLVIANRGGNSVSIVDAKQNRLRNVIGGCPGATDVAVLPDSTKAFAACSGGHQVMAIALADSKMNPGQPDRLEALMDVGRAPVQLALKPDGGELFVSNSASNSISEVVTTTNDVGGAYLMGDHPVNGIVSSDNSLLYVSNLRAQAVSIYSIDDGKLTGSIHVGDGPSAMAFSAEGHLLFVTDSRSGDVAVIRTSSRALFTMLPAGRNPNAIAVKAFKVQ